MQKNSRHIITTILLLLLCLTSQAARVVERVQADSMRIAQVSYNGRFCPLNTVARQFCLKLTGSTTFQGLTPEQVLLSWQLYPEEWKDVAMIKVKKAEVRQLIGLKDGKYAKFSDFFDAQGNYRLPPNKFSDIDDRLSLIALLTTGQLFSFLPTNLQPLSAKRVQAELLYNAVPTDTILFIVCFLLAISAFFLQNSPLRGAKGGLAVSRIVVALVALCAVFLAASLILRWYVSEHLPLTNTYESLLVIALTALIIAACSKRSRVAALLVAAVVMLVAHIGALDPQITALMPALQSPWLSSHVTTIMISYCLFALLVFRPNRAMLLWAEILLGVGIVLGSIWAKSAWGAYWQWDPKENWAAISFFIYLMPLLSRWIRWFRSPKHLKIYLRIAFLSILMTYFGCNYLFSGLHSYAN